MKCYVVMIASVFPYDHPKKGLPTGFYPNIVRGTKIHTIRKKFDNWKKRIDNVNNGTAYISIRQWDGVPRRSSQTELLKIFKGDIGIQKLEVKEGSFVIDDNIKNIETQTIAENDGLSVEDFNAWFPKLELPMAIIHFTDFRYS